MLYLTYWKVNEEMPIQERQEIAQRLTEEGLFPPENVELVRWDGTPDGWGIAIWEADSHEPLYDALNMWRAGGTPFFEETKTAPAAPVEEVLPRQAALVEELSARE